MNESAVESSLIGVVAIGRNEGERLRACLLSSKQATPRVVYVDSGSSDGSAAMAQAMGVTAVQLDLNIPFTAARARNKGFEKLLSLDPNLQFVQFVDGDCEMVDGWLARAEKELADHPKTAVVCGRRRERFPRASIYNKLCDIEWDTPIGPAKACGGDAMIRAAAFRQVNGYNSAIIAGEEPEMCLRLRQAGWQIMRLDAEMTLHDAAMTRFGQWWKRAVRAGHAYSEGAAMHGRSSHRHRVRETRSIWLWGAVLPILILSLAWRWRWASLLLLLGYPVLGYRIYRRKRCEGLPPKEAAFYALFTVLGKFPQMIGMIKFRIGKLSGQKSRVIEYKQSAASAEARERHGRELNHEDAKARRKN